MKHIIAIIQPDLLDNVRQALIDAEIFRVTVSRVTGHGQQEDRDQDRDDGEAFLIHYCHPARYCHALNDPEPVTVTAAVALGSSRWTM